MTTRTLFAFALAGLASLTPAGGFLLFLSAVLALLLWRVWAVHAR